MPAGPGINRESEFRNRIDGRGLIIMCGGRVVDGQSLDLKAADLVHELVELCLQALIARNVQLRFEENGQSLVKSRPSLLHVAISIVALPGIEEPFSLAYQKKGGVGEGSIRGMQKGRCGPRG